MTVKVTNYTLTNTSYVITLSFTVGDFDFTELPNGFAVASNFTGAISNPIVFQPSESKTFIFRGIALPNNFHIGYAVVNGVPPNQSASQNQFALSTGLPHVQIDGTGTPASLSSLIAAQTLIDGPSSCSFDPFPSPQFQTLYINGTFEIDTDYCFKRGSTVLESQTAPFIFMSEGAEIVVKSGNTLVLQRQVLGCTDMWGSIKVEHGATLSVSSALIEDGISAIRVEDGGILNVQSTKFRDNYVGIRLNGDYTTFDNTQLNIFANNIFEGTGELKPPYKNIGRPYAGVTLVNVPGVNLDGGIYGVNQFNNMVNGIVGNNSTFSVDNATFKDIHNSPFVPKVSGVAIYASSSPDLFSIADLDGLGGGASDSPAFENCDLGIKVVSINALVSNNKMQNVLTGIEAINHNNYQVLNLSGNWIEARDYGINLFNNKFTHFCLVSGNFIWMNQPPINNVRGTAIRGGFVDDIEMRSNYIELFEGKNAVWFNASYQNEFNANTINMGEQYNEYRGMFFEASSANIIRCNEINGNALVSTNTDGSVDEPNSDYRLSTGIRVVGASNNLIRCNDISHNRFGINAWGFCTPLYLMGNEHSKDFNSLLVGQFGSNGNDNGNGWIGDQGNTSFNPLHHGNRWLTNNSTNDTPNNDVFGAVHLGTDQIIQESIFKVNENISTGGAAEFMPAYDTPNEPGYVWFDQETNNAFVCDVDNTNNCPLGVGSPYNFLTEPPHQSETKIAGGEILVTDGYSEGLNWTAKQHLYRRLRQTPEVMDGNNVMQSFVNQQEQSLLGDLYEIEAGIDYSYQLSDNDANQLQTYRTQMETILQAIRQIDASFQTNISTAEYENLVIEKVGLLGELRTVQNLSNGIMTQVSTDLKSEIDWLAFQNENITPTKIYQDNEKIVNQIYLEYFTQEELELEPKTINTLQSIADQCPWSGGDAVFKARALLIPFNDKEYDDMLICGDDEQRQRRANEGASYKLLVYPNPTSQFVNIEIAKELLLANTDLTINLVNTLGQVVRTESISGNTIKVQFDVEHLPTGVYTCSVMRGEHRLLNRKIIVTGN
ncbi:MAG: T9SS type A sorting domain-containing protein [Bacteroidota bacterium]